MSIEHAHIRKWLTALGALCAGNPSEQDAIDKLTAYTTMLARRFPAGAFTATSLEEVAARCKFFPAYGEICDHLGAWWRHHRPNRFQALPPPSTEERAPPTDAERAMQAKSMAAFMAEIGNRAKAAAARKPDPAKPLHPEHLAQLRDADALIQRARAINAAVKAGKTAAQAAQEVLGDMGSR